MKFLMFVALLPLALTMMSCASNLQTSLILRYATIVTPDGYGSAVYLGKGYFLTAYHVILKDNGTLASDIEIVSAFGPIKDAVVVWYEKDFALLQTKLATNLSPVEIDTPDIAQEVYWVQPFWEHQQGLQLFVERGIVSRLGGSFNIDHNVALGVSGSGVWSSDGKLLGIMDAELVYTLDDQRQAFGEALMIPDTIQKIIGGVIK